jgi:hypothetical protein
MNREPWEDYSDSVDGPEPDSTGLNRETDPDDDFMGASIHEPSNLKLACESALKQSILKSHSDFCLAHGIKQDLGDGKNSDADKAAQCNGHFERMGRGE